MPSCLKKLNNYSAYRTNFCVNERVKEFDVCSKSFKRGYTSCDFISKNFKNEEFITTGWIKANFPTDWSDAIKQSVKRFIYNKVSKFNSNLNISESDFCLEKYHTFVSNEQHLNVINSFRGKFNFFGCGGIPLSELGIPFTDLDGFVNNTLQTSVKFSTNKKKFGFKFDKFWIRIIRPKINDNNPPHKDSHLQRLKHLVNIYLPLAGSNEHSSLPVITGSHLESDREYIVSESPCYIYGKSNTVPCIVHREKGLNLFTPNPSQEEILLFSSHLIHGGGINDNADTTRVSLEMRFSPVNI